MKSISTKAISCPVIFTILFSPALVLAQTPEGLPTESEPINLNNFADIFFFIIVPVLMLVFYLWWRRNYRKRR